MDGTADGGVLRKLVDASSQGLKGHVVRSSTNSSYRLTDQVLGNGALGPTIRCAILLSIAFIDTSQH